jgi:hypothetical protein
MSDFRLVIGESPPPNKSVQATAAARFRFLAFVFFIRPFCRPQSLSAAVPDLCRSSAAPTRLAWEITIKVRHLLLFGLVKNSFKIIG